MRHEVMRAINALSLAPNVSRWLADSRHPRILHVFDHACNLINERRDILSVVLPQIGNGPFNLVIDGDILFSHHLTAESRVSIRANQLYFGDLAVTIKNAKLWSPQPDWEALRARRSGILDQLRLLPIASYKPLLPDSLLSNLSCALVNLDISSALTLVPQLAGLGAGLTPAGDDFILGALLAAWIIHAADVAGILAEEITIIAVPLTTSLSAAWLRAAGKGEAGILWHEFFNALISGNTAAVQNSMNKILAVGETSGPDALAGFFTTLGKWAEETSAEIH
jgi:hypothetical protein